MKVRLIVYGEFRKMLGGKSFDLDLDGGLTVRELILSQGVPEKQLTYTMAIVNERKVELDEPLKDGDVVEVFQPVGGG